MAKRLSLAGYLRRSISPKNSELAQEILEKWRENEIPIWDLGNEWQERRVGVILGKALSKEMIVRFYAPVCPDYPLYSISAQLGTGLGDTIPPVISFMRGIIPLLEEYKVPHYFQVLLADTEIDIPEIIELLSDGPDDFLLRCKKTITTAQESTPDLFCNENHQFNTFSEFFGETWHTMQYFWENVVRTQMSKDERFKYILTNLATSRTQKYFFQMGRRLSREEKLDMAVRHYAQYHALGYWMRQYEGSIMINTDSPNLRAIRKPFVIQSETHPIPLDLPDQNKRIPIIVL